MSIFDIGLICLFLILILLYYASILPKDSILDRYTNKIPVITGFFISFGIYITYLIFNTNIDNTKRDTTYKIVDRGWLNVNQKIVEYYDKCPNFVESLYFSWQKNIPLYKINNILINKSDEWFIVNYLSILIFQSFEDFLTASEVDETGDHVWICNYIQWVNSPVLENRWSLLKSNFADTTIKLGDLLFYSVKNKQIKNIDDIKNLGHQIIESNDYKNIVEHRNYTN